MFDSDSLTNDDATNYRYFYTSDSLMVAYSLFPELKHIIPYSYELHGPELMFPNPTPTVESIQEAEPIVESVGPAIVQPLPQQPSNTLVLNKSKIGRPISKRLRVGSEIIEPYGAKQTQQIHDLEIQIRKLRKEHPEAGAQVAGAVKQDTKLITPQIRELNAEMSRNAVSKRACEIVRTNYTADLVTERNALLQAIKQCERDNLKTSEVLSDSSSNHSLSDHSDHEYLPNLTQTDTAQKTKQKKSPSTDIRKVKNADASRERRRQIKLQQTEFETQIAVLRSKLGEAATSIPQAQYKRADKESAKSHFQSEFEDLSPDQIRQLKNKISAIESRDRKKAYMEALKTELCALQECSARLKSQPKHRNYSSNDFLPQFKRQQSIASSMPPSLEEKRTNLIVRLNV